jgi:hypothetical protein
VWTDEQIRRLVSGRQAGEGAPVLSAAVGVPKTTVVRKLADLGVTGPPRRLIPAQDRQQIIDSYRSGLSERAVAEKVGRSRQAVRRVLDQAGVPRHPRGWRGPRPRPSWAHPRGQP